MFLFLSYFFQLLRIVFAISFTLIWQTIDGELTNQTKIESNASPESSLQTQVQEKSIKQMKSKKSFAEKHNLQEGETTTVKNPSKLLTLARNRPPIPGEYNNRAKDANHIVTKHNLKDVKHYDIIKTSTTEKQKICNNVEMYQQQFANSVRKQFNGKEAKKSFDVLKRRMESFASPPINKDIINFARRAEPLPHFHHHHHLHQQFDPQQFHQRQLDHHHKSIIKNIEINIDKNIFHQTPNIIDALNPLHHSTTTINNEHNTFTNGLLDVHQNVQIQRKNEPLKLEIDRYLSKIEPFAGESFIKGAEYLQSPYLIYAPHHNKQYRFRRTTIDDEPYKVFAAILKKEAQIMSNRGKRRVKMNTKNVKLTERNIDESQKDVGVTARRETYLNKAIDINRRSKRSDAIPLIQLMADPNKKLDMVKTLDNIGTITKKSFQDKKAPMYHLRNILGSAKDVAVSSLKVIPQDFLIPSQYKIMDKKGPEYEAFLTYQREGTNKVNNESVLVGAAVVAEEEGVPKSTTFLERLRKKFKLKSRFAAESEENSNNFVETFAKLGTILHDSILASQDTMKHVGNVVHSARKAYTTAKLATPRILLPYAKAPALTDGPSLLTRSSFSDQQPDKMVILAPRILEIEDDKNEPHPSDYEEQFLQFGHLTDALGLTKPEERRINLTKLIIHHKMTPKPPLLQARMQSRTNLESTITNNTNPYFFFAEIHSPDYESEEKFNNAKELNNSKGFNASEEFKETSDEIVSSRKETEEFPIALEGMVLQMKGEFDSIKSDVDALKKRFNQTKAIGLNFDLLRDNSPLKNFVLPKMKKKTQLLDVEKGVQISSHLNTNKRDLNSLKKNSTKLASLIDKLLQLKPEKFKHGHLTDEELERNVALNIREVFGSPYALPIPASAPLEDEIVGIGLPLGPNLFKPFMGQPSEAELKVFLAENNDNLKLLNVLEDVDNDGDNDGNRNENDRGNNEIVGAINPIVFEKYFKEPLKLKGSNNSVEEDKVGVKMPNKLLKPFLGEVDYDILYDFDDVRSRYEDIDDTSN